MTIRTMCLTAIQEFLQANYEGSVTILKQEDDASLQPPYAIVRIGSAEDIGLGQYEMWDLNVIVAVFHDADAVSIETAESAAAEVFAVLAASDDLIAFLEDEGVIASAWDSLTTEAGYDGNAWQHFQGYRLIASPQAGD